MPGTTTNFGFPYPVDTDALADGAQEIENLATDLDTTLVDLKGGTSGQYLAKNSNTDMDFVWNTVTIPTGFPMPGAANYVSNRNFTFHDDIGAANTVANAMVLIPVFFSGTKTLDRIAVEVTTAAAASTVRLGIYDDDGTGGQPGTLLLDAGTVSSATVGVKEATISQSVSGLVYFAYVSSSNSVALRCLVRSAGANAAYNMFYYGTANTDPFAAAPTIWRKTGVTGALPTPAAATATASSNTSGSVIIAARVV